MIYETEIPCFNGMKDVLREGIKLCAIFRQMKCFSRAGGNFRGGGGLKI